VRLVGLGQCATKMAKSDISWYRENPIATAVEGPPVLAPALQPVGCSPHQLPRWSTHDPQIDDSRSRHVSGAKPLERALQLFGRGRLGSGSGRCKTLNHEPLRIPPALYGSESSSNIRTLAKTFGSGGRCK
jgi:hypothetical protein